MRYVCSADGCQLTETGEHHVQESDVLVLKRTQQTIRAVDQRSGAERYLLTGSTIFCLAIFKLVNISILRERFTAYNHNLYDFTSFLKQQF